MTEVKPVTTEEFRKQIDGWMKYMEFTGSWYTQEEWERRGEFCLCGAPLHLVSDDFSMTDGTEDDSLYPLLNSLGWWFERGFAWSMHFWPEGYWESVPKEQGIAWRNKEKAGWGKHLENFDPMCD